MAGSATPTSDAATTTDIAPTTASFPPTRQARRAHLASSMQAAPAATSSSTPPSSSTDDKDKDPLLPGAEHTQDASLFRIGITLLESTLLLLSFEDAQAFRQSCRTVRAVTVQKGFARLWRLTHKGDVLAKRELTRMKREFATLDADYTLSTQPMPVPGSEWTRVLPPKRKAVSSSPPPSMATSAASTSTSSSSSSSSSSSASRSRGYGQRNDEEPTPRRTLGSASGTKKASRTATADLQRLCDHFAEVDSFKIESVVVGE